MWREKLRGNVSSSPVLVGDKLYLATEDGVAYVVKVSPAGWKDPLLAIDSAEKPPS